MYCIYYCVQQHSLYTVVKKRNITIYLSASFLLCKYTKYLNCHV